MKRVGYSKRHPARRLGPDGGVRLGRFLSLVGSLAAIFGNAAGRFFWASISDTLGFKRPFIVLTLIQARGERWSGERPSVGAAVRA